MKSAEGKKLVAAIDQGTTSTRCIIFDDTGAPVSSAQREHRQIYPRPGWVEHDPAEIWDAAAAVIREAVGSPAARGGELVAVGVTNQRETTLVWERETGKPCHNAIVWQDTRTDSICNQLAGEAGAGRYRSTTGLPLATYFAGPKLKWLLDNVDGLRGRAERGEVLFGTIDTWIIWKLTGAHVTDVTNASRTMLMNLAGCRWSEEMLDVFGVPSAMLPEIRPSSDPAFYGYTDPAGPFGREVPVCAALGDQQAALVGQTCFGPGEAKNTYGTGCFLLLNTGDKAVESKHGLLTTVAYQLGDAPVCYALEGSVPVAGSLVQWLRDSMKMFQRADEVEELARTVDDNGDVYFVPAFSGLFAPHWRSDARGAIVGLTGYANRGHIARAALEAVAFQTRDVVDAMALDSGIALDALKVDGGMTANGLLMQIQADVLGVEVVRPTVLESTALGAAYGAGLAVGVWKGTDELKTMWRSDKRWQPGADEELRTVAHEKWKKALERSLCWAGCDTTG